MLIFSIRIKLELPFFLHRPIQQLCSFLQASCRYHVILNSSCWALKFLLSLDMIFKSVNNLQICRIHKDSPVIPILSQMNPIPRIDTYFFKVHPNIASHLRLGLPKGLFPAGVPVNILEALLSFSVLATDSDILHWCKIFFQV